MSTAPGARFARRPLPPAYLLRLRKPKSIGEAQATYDHARTCAFLLDGLGQLSGVKGSGGLDLGIDPILSLFAPLLGDFVGLILGLYIVFLAFLLDAPPTALARMGGNLALDSCTGLIPLAGPVIDALFQANLANMQILETHLRKSKWVAIGLPAPRSWLPSFGRRDKPMRGL